MISLAVWVCACPLRESWDSKYGVSITYGTGKIVKPSYTILYHPETGIYIANLVWNHVCAMVKL